MKLLWSIFSSWMMKPIYQAAIIMLIIIVVIMAVKLRKAQNG